MNVEEVLAGILNDVTEEGQTVADYWSPEVIRILGQKGYRVIRDYSLVPEDDASTQPVETVP